MSDIHMNEVINTETKFHIVPIIISIVFSLLIGVVLGMLICKNTVVDKHEQLICDIPYETLDSLQATSVMYTSHILAQTIHMPRLSELEKINFAHSVITACEISGINDPYLFYAMAFVESSYNPNAIGTKSEVGLFQIMPQTAQYILEQTNNQSAAINLHDIRANTVLASIYLKMLLEKYKHIQLALAHYNGRDSLPNEYVTKVISVREDLIEETSMHRIKEYTKGDNFEWRQDDNSATQEQNDSKTINTETSTEER